MDIGIVNNKYNKTRQQMICDNNRMMVERLLAQYFEYILEYHPYQRLNLTMNIQEAGSTSIE